MTPRETNNRTLSDAIDCRAWQGDSRTGCGTVEECSRDEERVAEEFRPCLITAWLRLRLRLVSHVPENQASEVPTRRRNVRRDGRQVKAGGTAQLILIE